MSRNRPKPRHFLGLVWALSLVAAPLALAQEPCRTTESVNACIARLTDEIRGEVKDQAARAQTDVKKKTETSLQDLNGLSSSMKDFLPLLQIGGALGDVKTDETTGAVSVALNARFLGPSGKLTQDPSLQLKAVIETKPKLFDELRQRLPEANREALEKSLLGGKTDAEHSTLYVSYNFTSRRLGRNFAQHMETYRQLFGQAAPPATAEAAQLDAAVRRELIIALGKDVSLDDKWGEIPAATRLAAQPILFKNARAHLALQMAFADSVKRSGLDLFGQLINNQPQLTITASRSFRDDLFGPDLFSGRATYEMGLGNNLNGFFNEFDPRRCKDEPEKCLAKYSGYVNDGSTRANIKAASRLAVYAEFVQHEAYHYANESAGLDVTLAKGTTLAGGLDFGRLFGVNDDGAADGRVDASLRYERRSEAPEETRFVASLTVTKKIGELSIPFGVVYANKPRFLVGVDKGLTASVGLKFNLFK